MEYFLLKPFQGGCKIKIINKDTDILICKIVKDGDMPDFTLNPRPLISDRFKNLLEQYLPNMDFTPCIVEGKGEPDFWTFDPKELSADQAEYELDGAVKALSYTGLYPVFLVPNYKKPSYIVNLALAESMLRRGFLNLELIRIKWQGGEICGQSDRSKKDEGGSGDAH